MRYVYVVTRVVDGNSLGVTPIPNLGVHMSFRKASKHYEAVVADRRKYQRIQWVREVSVDFYPDNPYTVIREALVYNRDKTTETLRLEKWKIRK